MRLRRFATGLRLARSQAGVTTTTRAWAMKAGVTIPHSAHDAPQAMWAAVK